MLLELGGKAPLIVLEDADLKEAVKAAAFGAFMNQGQICMSTERIIVVDAVADSVPAELFKARRFKPRWQSRRSSPSASTPLGADRGPASTVATGRPPWWRMHVQRRRRPAARPAGTSDGVLMPAPMPSISVTPSDETVPRGELSARWWRSSARGTTAHAVELANDTEYGLSASAIFTRDIRARPARWHASIKSGICHINGPTVHDEAQMPFGGVKGIRLWSVRRPRRHRCLHRAALDHHRDPAWPFPDLTAASASGGAPQDEHYCARPDRTEEDTVAFEVEGPHRLGAVQPPRKTQLHEPQAQSPHALPCWTGWSTIQT